MKFSFSKLVTTAAVFFVAQMAGASLSQTVTIKNGKGEDMGTAILTEGKKGVRVKLDVKGLTPGEHAIHFHEKSDCTGPKFESAGGHFAPAKNAHGFEAHGGPHAGDMKNITANAEGIVKSEFDASGVTLKDSPTSLLKAGAALIIHADKDDYKSQPAGNAGARIACGVIKAAQ